ncbi:MAG: tRNA pseudouridine13 synthase [Natronomonas sp.]|jgi:tRNA pseudouridine13 synthase|uniref:tRNA pseudouridine(13) synthase TruD n=1 Tax=Natronomonas sp. TaxID=2184060 RepID=UPI003988B579
MRESHPVEQAVGIEYYVSETDGVGGHLRDRPEDFRVREREAFDADLRPVDAATGSYPHLVFRATLRRWDTNDFASALSNELEMSRERVSWAGTKDKHAVTTQLFSVRTDRNDLPPIGDADIEVLGRAGRPVLFGDLAGNEFEVVVRDADRPENADAIAEELRAFAADGEGEAHADEAAVPNVFGQQRFGSKRPITHRVGLAIVRGDWETAAVRYVCESSEREREATREAREHVGETRDWEAALDRLPNYLRFERAIASRLAESADSPDDYRESLETLPTNLQRMFVNAAQSYAFNCILSERLERGLPFGRPVSGDVVCFADSEGVPDPDRTQAVDEGRIETVQRHCERGRAFVTAPLVGTDTEFGGGEPADIAHGILDDLDIERSDFALPGEFDSTGTRRAIRVTSALDIEADPLTLRFALPKGSYATAFAREFLKVDPDDLS